MRIRQHIGNVDIHIDTKRIDRNLKEAQKLLNMHYVLKVYDEVRKEFLPAGIKRDPFLGKI